MLHIFKKNFPHIGVSISDKQIEIIEMVSAENKLFKVINTSVLDIEKGIIENGKILDLERLTAFLKKAYNKTGHKFSTNTVYAVLPDSMTYFHVFDFPGAFSDDEIVNAVSFKFEEIFPMPMTSAFFDYAIVMRTPEKTIVQYAAAPKETINKFSDCFTNAGLKLAGIGLLSQAVSKVVLGEPMEKKATLVSYVTNESATIFIRNLFGLHSTFSVIFDGSDSIDKILDKKITEIVSWYKRINPEDIIDDLVLCGDTEIISGLKSKMEKLLGDDEPAIKVRIGDTLGRVSNGETLKENKKENKDVLFYVSAIGAAIQELDPCDRKFELLPSASCGPTVVKSKYVTTSGNKSKSFVHLEDIKYNLEIIPKKRQIFFAGIFISVAIIILAGVLVWYIRGSGEKKAVINKIVKAIN